MVVKKGAGDYIFTWANPPLKGMKADAASVYADPIHTKSDPPRS
jgi:hypothetical protein